MDIPEYAKDLIWKIPLAKGEKVPIIKDIKSTPENRTKFDQEYFNKHDGNWAFYTGQNKIVVIDLDCRQGKKAEIFKLINKLDTKIIETPHGYHVYYLINKPKKTEHYDNCGYSKTLKKFYSVNKTKHADKLKGIDILSGEFSFVVGENSTVDRFIYKAINKHPIKQIYDADLDTVINKWILRKEKRMREGFAEIFRGRIDPNDIAQQTGESEFVYWKFAYIEALNFGVAPEELFDGLNKLNKGFDLKKTKAQLRSDNKPYTESGKPKDKMTPERYNKYFPKNKIRVKKTTKKKEIKPYLKIAKTVLNKFDIITLTDSDELLIKGSNIYKKDTKGLINKELNKQIESYNMTYISTKNNILRYIKDHTLFDRNDFCYDTNLINFSNGYINLDEEPIKLHQNDKMFPFEIPYDYEYEEYDCPKYKDALNKWLGSNSVFSPSDMFEMIGYCMTLDISQKKAFMIYGEKDTGKTQNLSIILALIGKENYAQIELQRLDKDQFGTVGLEFIMLDVDDDLPNRKLKGASKFKKMVGGLEYVPAERKGGNQFSFKNTVRFIFNCNEIPQAYDAHDEAFFVRWILCNFSRRFDENDTDTIKDFANVIIQDANEMQGIIHEAIKGVKRLRERGQFREEVRLDTTRVWQRISNPLFEFIDDYCLKGSSYAIKTSDFKEVFNSFLGIEGKCEPYSNQKLIREMEKLRIFKKRKDDKHYFARIKIKDIAYNKYIDDEEPNMPKFDDSYNKKRRDLAKWGLT